MTRETLPYWHVDAFASRPFTGNQAAVIPLEEWLPDETLCAIAAENNFAETAFIVADKSARADYELRWFTPTVEVALCGHATLAAGHVLIERDGADLVRFRTRKAGLLTVRRTSEGHYDLALPATEMAPAEHPGLFDALGTGGLLFRSVGGAEDTAIVLLENEAAVRALVPDMRALSEIELMAICTAPGERTDIVSRVFVPAWGVEEDSVTGSAHAALTPFWAKRLGRSSFTAHQASARGGDLDCRLEGDSAVLGGACVTVVEGRFFL